MEILQTAYDNAVKETPSVEYVAYVKYSGTNAMGGTVSNRSIIIVDNKGAKKILGYLPEWNDEVFDQVLDQVENYKTYN